MVAEASEGFKHLMTFYEPVGPLGGKTTVAVALWLVAWAILHWRLRDREIALSRSIAWTWRLVAIGLLGTFPPFFQLFAAE